MAASSYDEALARLLVHEGGYSNHPSDPGGPTNWGITLRDARAYWKRDATASDVRAMPVAIAKGIYRSKYWAAMRCDDLPAGVDYAVFDYGVNSGVSRAAKVLQRLIGFIGGDVDGEIGDKTVAAAAKADPGKLINAICDERLAFLQGGQGEIRVVGLTPGVQVAGTEAQIELRWSKAYRPIPFSSAPLLINNARVSAFPAVYLALRLDEIDRTTLCGAAVAGFEVGQQRLVMNWRRKSSSGLPLLSYRKLPPILRPSKREAELGG